MTGVINLRGNVVPLVDLRQKFGMGATEPGVETAIVVIEIPLGGDEGKILTIGIFADAVHKVITIEEETIEPPPRIGLAIDTAFIAGMGHVDDRFITILAIAEILSAKELDTASSVERENATVEPTA